MQARVRIKLCGITCVEDALAAADAGVDAIGLNFHPPSPRYVDAGTAAEICAALPPFVTIVGLSVDLPRPELEAILDSVPLDMLQFHGSEAPEACEAPGLPYLKVLRMGPDVDAAREAQAYGSAQGILLDSYVRGVPGGTGRTFDWDRVPALGRRLVLAGGLTAENVAEAIRATRPWAVDVSGGVERSPGRKDPERIASFVRAVAEVTT